MNAVQPLHTHDNEQLSIKLCRFIIGLLILEYYVSMNDGVWNKGTTLLPY